MKLSFALLIGLAGCGNSVCYYPCLDNPNHLPLAANYATEREKHEPGYLVAMDKLRSDPDYQKSVAQIDREIARLDAILAESRAVQQESQRLHDLNTPPDPIIIYEYVPARGQRHY